MKKIFVINPGSTSTKLALYNDSQLVWKTTLMHSAEDIARFPHPIDQLDYRTAQMYSAIEEAGIDGGFDAVIARGGLLQPTPGGVYIVDEGICYDLIHSPNEHACNLGALMADELARECGCPALIADPEVVDERLPEAKMTGLPEMPKVSIFHALNSKAVSRRYAESLGRTYEDVNLIVVHLGGGITVSAHRKGRVIDVNDGINGDGPFTPERSGTLPASQLIDLCFSGRYTQRELKRMVNGNGGLKAYLQTTDVADIAARATRGEQPYKQVLDAMLYGVAKEVGARAVTLGGQIDAIILTGGIAHSDYCVNYLTDHISFLAPVFVRAGEDELGALADNALRFLNGSIPPTTYIPASARTPFAPAKN